MACALVAVVHGSMNLYGPISLSQCDSKYYYVKLFRVWNEVEI